MLASPPYEGHRGVRGGAAPLPPRGLAAVPAPGRCWGGRGGDLPHAVLEKGGGELERVGMEGGAKGTVSSNVQI